MARDLEIIQTDRLILRGINEEDTYEIVKWRSDPEVYRFFKNPHQISVKEHLAWYNNSYLVNEDRFDWMCIEKATGGKVGVFGLAKTSDCVEVNYLLAPEAQHKGYAAESIEGIIRYARKKWHVKRVVAEIHRDNTPSLALVQGMGFKMSAQKDEFVLYAIEG